MIHSPAPEPRGAPAARHQKAVEQTLSWAQAAAETGDYAEALAWLDTVDYVHRGLPPGWRQRRVRWEKLAREQGRPDA